MRHRRIRLRRREMDRKAIKSPAKERVVPETISRRDDRKLSAQVTPKLGANLISFKVDGAELIYWDEKGFLADGTFTGAFNMFPTPCRLANCSYEFEGRRIVQKKRGKEVFIHGLVRNEIMEWRNNGDKITSWLDITPAHPVFEGFPFKCTFSITHALHKTGLTVSFKVQNNDSCNIPFGYGIHPFWRIQGQRKDVSVSIPCDYILELKDLVPTGGCSPVAGSDMDLRTLRNIQELFIDNVFWKRQPGDTAEIVFKSIGKRIIIEAENNFPHMIVYAPEGEPFLCVENLTTCPNAPNLVTAGKGDLAGMLVVPPGETTEGWIKYSVESIGD